MSKKFILFIISSLVFMGLTSCQSYSDGRMLKKFISRFNANEYSCAAAYVYPGDQMNLAFFAKEAKTLAPSSFIKLLDYKTEGKGDDRYIAATLKWHNTTPALRKYFNSIGAPLDSKDCQKVKLKVRDTNDGETLSFIWGVPGVLSDNLWIASVEEKDGKPVKSVGIYSEPSSKSKKIMEMDHDLIVGQEDDNGWMPAYQVTKDGDITTTYIKKDDVNLDRTAYFTLGIFDSMSVIVALVVIIIIIVPLFMFHSAIESLFTLPIYGPIICIVLLLGLIYIIYQLLEKILFELFIINLPY